VQTGQLVRAEIVNLDDTSAAAVRCMFNPKQYTISKSNDWSAIKRKTEEVPSPEYGGGAGATLTLELTFDTYEVHAWFNNSAGEDVRNYTKGLWDMMKIDARKKRPPHCKFQWGSLWSFEAVITQISQSFTLFLPNGTPVRSTVTVNFTQVKDEAQYPRQNPTSGGQEGERLRIVCEGETLTAIAYEEYGDSAVWRHIADANNIRDPRRLRVGQALIITPLPQ
jgi:Contractile injection system tube protein/LysM domain